MKREWIDGKVTREAAIVELKNWQTVTDSEAAHAEADDVICDLLRELGYGDVVDEYEKVDKWYS